MQERRKFSPAQKVAIIREHLIEGVPISTLCDKHGIYPTLFYQWQTTFFQNGEAAFQRSPRIESKHHQDRLEALQAKLKSKDEVIAEIMAEHILLKKELGEI